MLRAIAKPQISNRKNNDVQRIARALKRPVQLVNRVADHLQKRCLDIQLTPQQLDDAGFTNDPFRTWTIPQWVEMLYMHTDLGTILRASALLDRFCQTGRIITFHTIFRVFFVCVLIEHSVETTVVRDLETWANISNSWVAQELRVFERIIIDILQWRLHVSNEEVLRILFELTPP
eukprot:TRINITY_DN19547_c0_g1::TRINITY_DN19547_c0_g1_i1::g.24542::m.24542 TRINITY_DN19547_c0_g1::TRINITY_DN19547_c0_g1_i1::g.24542  ORF type:complete len:176 (+),score=-2.43,Cyclin_N/PF00134.18/7e-07 TRINITY_DN19547_c0_g1_i1:91-618(+)